MTANYRTTISDKRWIAYDIPGNIGWITWLMCTVKEIREKGVIRSITAIVPAVFMLIGVCELISERIAGLDRVLPGERLFRGFGALMAGGLLGIPVSVSEFRKDRKRSGIMLTASLLCAVFAGLLFVEYKKE
jgi:hypothetical protein